MHADDLLLAMHFLVVDERTVGPTDRRMCGRTEITLGGLRDIFPSIKAKPVIIIFVVIAAVTFSDSE